MSQLALLPLAFIPLATVELAKAARWRTLSGDSAPTYRRFLQAHVAMLSANLLSPFRGGEVVGVGLLAFRGGGVAPTAVALGVGKGLDALVLAAIAAALVGMPWLDTNGLRLPPLDGLSWTLLLPRAVIVGIVVLFSTAAWHAVRAWATRWRLASALRIDHLAEPFARLRDPRALATVGLTCSVVWVCGGLANAVVLAAFGLAPSLDLVARILVSGYLASLLPSPPANVGVYEAGVVAALLTGGVPLESAVGVAVAVHVLVLATVGLLSAGLLVGRRWSPSV